MRILLLGAGGQLGHALRLQLAHLGAISAPLRAELDLSELAATERAAQDYDLVVNAAAWTDVPGAEAQPEAAWRINAQAPAALARGVANSGGFLLHYSTDYVFDGRTAPYSEDAAPAPLNAYGRGKLAGEQAIRASGCAHLIVRSGWIYSLRGRNFVRAVLDQLDRGMPLRAPIDQFGGPTSAEALARLTAALIESSGASAAGLASAVRERGSLLHAACAGRASRHDLACAVAATWAAGHGCTAPAVAPTTTAALAEPVQRPADSTLALDRLHKLWGMQPVPWQEALQACLAGCDNPRSGSTVPPA